jgi:prevent-host-death family protein
MTREIGIEDARKILGELVDEAAAGADVLLTRHRRPIARLTAYKEPTVVDLAELTRRFGLPAHEQSAVAAWTGDPYGTTWSEEDADQLHQAWEADQIRIDDERG